MRVLVTGAGGFVGSNVAAVLARHGAEVLAPGHAQLDLTDAAAVSRHVADARPDGIVHAAIWNDPAGLTTRRRKAWDAYVGATRAVVDAANRAQAHVVLVSTDWVFDGTQGPATEDEPPNPVNAYGFLKAASELVVTERAQRGTVARIAAVQGVHRARPSTPRAQDAGFGYLAASVADALAAGRRFTVWDGPGLNRLATPVLATDAAEMILRALQRQITGTLHCVGADHVDRVTLARRTAAAFGFDPDAIETGPPDPQVVGTQPIPEDTRLDGSATARRLGIELPDLATTLARLREEIEAAMPREWPPRSPCSAPSSSG
jgi:dTDP-4-dehydrorhamnose reductase